MRVLVLNGGSSSIKAMLYDFSEGGPPPSAARAPSWTAHAEWGRQPGRTLVRVARPGKGAPAEKEIEGDSAGPAFDYVITALWSGEAAVVSGPKEITAVGHRIVHGGLHLREPARITNEVRNAIAAAAELAPEHNQRQLDGIDTATRLLGSDVPQFAVFDTSFHATIPDSAAAYGLPLDLFESGVRRYGFHGTSHQYAARRAAEILGRDLSGLRLVTCHLGNGASLAAIRDGRSVDTTMGFTPLEGLVMGTRSGSVDPSILTWLMRHREYEAGQVDRLLNKESGLKGLSGISGDMREIEAAIDRGDSRASFAWEVFMQRLCREFGSMLPSLGGLDVVVFTGGIGENSARVRDALARRFAFVGMLLDGVKNKDSAPDTDISQAESAVRILIVHAEEDWEIARECVHLLRSG